MELNNVICSTPEEFHSECEKWAGKSVIRGRKLIAYGTVVAELNQSTRGRKKVEGDRHMYTVADDVHSWIMSHGGGQYLNDTIRVIMSVQR